MHVPQGFVFDLTASSRRRFTVRQSALYPTLDHGVAAPGECLRKVATPPVVVPLITGPPGSSSNRHDGGGKSWSGEFLPTMGRFPAGETPCLHVFVRLCVCVCVCVFLLLGTCVRLWKAAVPLLVYLPAPSKVPSRRGWRWRGVFSLP